MKQHVPYPQKYKKDKRYIVIAVPRGLARGIKNVGFFATLLVITNWYTFQWAGKGNPQPKTMAHTESIKHVQPDLYLIDKASKYVKDVPGFSQKVHEIALQLQVPSEWLMAVMYTESKFDVSVYNYKGSGAVGLIQFMPSTARSLNTSSLELSKMGHKDQLDYVYLYLDRVRYRYGNYTDLTDLYLGILYPKARGKPACHTLFAKPSKSYRQNSGLDEDRDGRITVYDIDRRLARLFPTAYQIQPEHVLTQVNVPEF